MIALCRNGWSYVSFKRDSSKISQEYTTKTNVISLDQVQICMMLL